MLNAGELTMTRVLSLISKNSSKKRFYRREKMHRALIIQGKKFVTRTMIGLPYSHTWAGEVRKASQTGGHQKRSGRMQKCYARWRTELPLDELTSAKARGERAEHPWATFTKSGCWEVESRTGRARSEKSHVIKTLASRAVRT